MKKLFDNTEDDDKEDLYDGFEPEQPAPPKPEPLRPDDPRYWDRDPSRWEHLTPSRPKRLLIYAIGAVMGVLVLWLGWQLIFGVQVDDAVQYGYIDHIERRGMVFKTYEGTLLPYKNLHDTTRAYDGDFHFSTAQDLGVVLRTYQNSGRPLRLEYRTYRRTLPWRGDERTVVVRVDTVSPDSILPPKTTIIRERQ